MNLLVFVIIINRYFDKNLYILCHNRFVHLILYISLINRFLEIQFIHLNNK